MRVTQRQVALGMQAMVIAGLIVLAAYQISAGSPSSAIVLNIAGILITVVLLLAYLRGWPYVTIAIIVMSTLLSGILPPQPVFSIATILSLFVPPLTALILGGPLWVVASAAGVFLIFVLRSDPQAIIGDPPFYIFALLLIGGMLLARLVTDTALADTLRNEQRAEQALARATEQSQHLAHVNQQIEQQLAKQQQLIDLVATLEAPVSPLAAGVLFAPVVGYLDAQRTQALTGRLLAAASAQRSRAVILDIAGISTIDTAVARGLLHAGQALRLLGCEVILSGISAEVALTLTHLNLDLGGMKTVRNPQEALARYLNAESRPAHQ